jgi:CDP-glucose 4,6-dehydratase
LAGLLQEPEKHKGTWNFGPLNQKALKVKDVIKSLGRHWEMPETHYGTEALPESCHLQLNSTKAHNHLNWTPLWDTEESIRQTALWYKTYTQLPQFVSQLTQQQIDQWLTRSDQ